MVPFYEKRRQQFLYEELYLNNRNDLLERIELCRQEVKAAEADHNSSYGYGTKSHVISQADVFYQCFWLWMLDYTGGVPMDELAPQLKNVVDEFEEWHKINLLYREYLKKNIQKTMLN